MSKKLHPLLFPLLFSLSLFASLSLSFEVRFYNDLEEKVILYWDSYGNSPDSKGLVLMGEIPPHVPYPISTHPNHVFEVQTLTGETLEIIQALPSMESFRISSVRHCGVNENDRTHEKSLSSLFPDLLQCSAFLAEAVNHFRHNVIPMYRANQVLGDDPSVLQQRESNEQRRLWLNSNQPKMTPKFTKVGYAYASLPDAAWLPLLEYWHNNKHRMEKEKWRPQDHHVNHWESPTYVLFLPSNIQNAIIRAMHPILEEWVGGEPLEFTALYGIRIYKNNSYLLNHVDRSATHAVSAIIQVDQKVDEDWMLEVVGHDSITKHLKLQPKEVILYESASVIHGRPKKLNGEYFANVFVHFRPRDNWHLDSL